MKSVEECFLEIIENIRNGIVAKQENLRINNDYMFLKEHGYFGDSTYSFEGKIDLDDNYTLYYIFSNKKTFIYTTTKTYDNILFSAHIINFKYAEYLVNIYNIDKFIFKLSQLLNKFETN